jgi:hypothetical protein
VGQNSMELVNMLWNPGLLLPLLSRGKTNRLETAQLLVSIRFERFRIAPGRIKNVSKIVFSSSLDYGEYFSMFSSLSFNSGVCCI